MKLLLVKTLAGKGKKRPSRMLLLVLRLLFLRAAITEGARILGIMNLPSPSHYIFNRALFLQLARRGHEVTVISPDTENESVSNMTNILLEGIYDKMRYGVQYERFSKMSSYAILHDIFHSSVDVCELVLNTNGARQLLQHPGPFDLIVLEATVSECFLGFVPHFGSPPLVAISAFGIFPTTAWDHGVPEFPSYIINHLLPYDAHDLGFWDKLDNAIFQWYTLYRHYNQFLYQQDGIARKFFGSDIPFVGDIAKNITLVLVNLAAGIDDPRPLPPSVVPVGGMHIPLHPNPLPQDLQGYLDDAKDGFIFFSLGTNLRSADMSPYKRRIFLDAFRQLAPVRVIWKWEEDSLPGQPENVRIRKWLPQSDLLAHQNIRAFISHCGRMSTLEAIHHRVPVVGIPLLWDQVANYNKLRRLGVAVRLDYHTMNTKRVLKALRQVLYNSSYRIKAGELSAVFRDQLEHPLDRAVFWTEYVMRHGHKAAETLKPVSANLSWYLYLLLDVFLLVLIVAVSVAILLLLLVRYIWRTFIAKVRAKRKAQ